MNPTVTIGVASYNNAAYIIETLNSVKNQGYQFIELIIIDDCSTDNSVTIINNWIDQNCIDCIFIVNDKNMGLTAVCNQLLKISNGEYITWLGSDDILSSNKINEQIQVFEKCSPNTAVVFSDAKLINEKGEVLMDRIIGNKLDPFESPFLILKKPFEKLIKGNFIPACGIMARKEFILKEGGYNESLVIEDWYMWLKLSQTYDFVFIPKIHAEYRKHSNSIFHGGSWDYYVSNIQILKQYLHWSKKEVREIVTAGVIDNSIYLYKKQPYKSIPYLLYAFKISFNIKLLVFLGLAFINLNYFKKAPTT